MNLQGGVQGTICTPHTSTVNVIRNLGRSIFFGALLPWLLSILMRMRPWFFIGCVIAFLIPRFMFRQRTVRLAIEWSTQDSAWTALALALAVAYFSALTPLEIVRLLG